MAELTLLALPCAVNDSETLIDGEINDQPAILSTRIADHFNKNHKNILRDIDALHSIVSQSFWNANFKLAYFEVAGPNGGTRKERAYLLTRDAFSLLVMGMTGKAAIFWKLRYIEAFNVLEKAAADRVAELSAEAAYLAGRQEALSQPVMEAERKKGFLEGFKEGKRVAARNDKLDALIRIRGYIEKGLSYREIGKILDLSESAVSKRVSRAKKMGFWPAMQGTLLGGAR